MNFSLQILGSSSAVPTKDRNQTALLLDLGNESLLFDAGESVQKQLLIYGIKSFKISYIFISHLHPDHYIGLIGLLCSWGLMNRTSPLTIVSPVGIEDIINVQLKTSGIELSYSIRFIEPGKENDEIVLNTDRFLVKSYILKHRIPCFGYLIKETKHERKLIADKITSDIPFEAYPILKSGRNYPLKTGKELKWQELTLEPAPSKSFAYFTDTAVRNELAKYVLNVDLLYHDSTFLGSLTEKAKATGHSTTIQAAQFAKSGKVKKLLLGHFSSRYGNLAELEQEAREIFTESYLATEGRIFEVNYKQP